MTPKVSGVRSSHRPLKLPDKAAFFIYIMQKIRQQLRFTGQVQGVGFRYTAYHLAVPLGLTGWVKNLWDERVEMEVQGEEMQIERLIEELSRGRYIYIDRIEMETIPVDVHESSFRVTGY